MRQVLVQRMILPGGSTANQSYDVLKAKNIENTRESSATNTVEQSSCAESLTSPASAAMTTTEVSTIMPLHHNPPTISNSSPFISITNSSYSDSDTAGGLEQVDNNPSTSGIYKMSANNVNTNNTDLVARFFQSSAIDNADVSLSSSFPDSAFDESTSK